MKRSSGFYALGYLVGRWRLLMTFLAILLMAGAARGQSETQRDTQVWVDYDPTWRLRERWTLDVDIASRYAFSDPPIWQIRLQPTLEYSLRKWIDLTGGVWFIYSAQFDTFDRLEIRPIVGVRVKRDVGRGIRLSNLFRAEYRIQRNLGMGETVTAGRLRNRIQAMIPINHRSLSEDDTWYAFADAEWFWQRDQQVDDGFNSRRRYRAGIAWRKNSTWTYQLYYGFQRSRNTATESFTTADDIIGFTLIQTFK